MIDLRCSAVGKRYRRRPPNGGSDGGLWAALFGGWEHFWAVRDLSFDVERGEAVGIIGRNGAGKSTLLKLLSRITAPTRGEITIEGRLSALIEIGSGFHPELSGRENVYLNGAILGMRRREIAAKLDRIVDFAGLRPFIDTPVKWYSSGMFVRLGFAIAAHLEPEILLLDEVLAVGDLAFQAQCLDRVEEMRRAGTTVVFISHDLRAVERLCGRVLLMHEGTIVRSGLSADVIGHYLKTSMADVPARVSDASAVRLTSVSVEDGAQSSSAVFRPGEPITIRVDYAAAHRVAEVVFELWWYSVDGSLQCVLSTETLADTTIETGNGSVRFFCPELGLRPGIYRIDAGIRRRNSPVALPYLHRWPASAVIRVDPGRPVHGAFHMPHGWQIDVPAATGANGTSAAAFPQRGR